MKHVILMCLGLLWAGTVFTETSVTMPYGEEPHAKDLEIEYTVDGFKDMVNQVYRAEMAGDSDPMGDGLSIELDGAPVEQKRVMDNSLFIQGMAVLLLAVGSVIILGVFMKVTEVAGEPVITPDKTMIDPRVTNLPSDGTC